MNPAWMAHTSPRDWLLDGQRCPPDVWDDLDWAIAWVNPGPSPEGVPGPYWHVTRKSVEQAHRLYPKLPAKWVEVMARAVSEMGERR